MMWTPSVDVFVCLVSLLYVSVYLISHPLFSMVEHRVVLLLLSRAAFSRSVL